MIVNRDFIFSATNRFGLDSFMDEVKATMRAHIRANSRVEKIHFRVQVWEENDDNV